MGSLPTGSAVVASVAVPPETEPVPMELPLS